MYSFINVSYGTKHSDVVVLQTVLSMLHYTGKDGKPLKIDGHAGENTVHAINLFQENMRAYGHECGTNGKNDGCFGKLCWKLLGVM